MRQIVQLAATETPAGPVGPGHAPQARYPSPSITPVTIRGGFGSSWLGQRNATSARSDAPKVREGEPSRCTDATCNDKHNDKRAEVGQELQAVIVAWPGLPEAARAGILAMVKASRKG